MFRGFWNWIDVPINLVPFRVISYLSSRLISVYMAVENYASCTVNGANFLFRVLSAPRSVENFLERISIHEEHAWNGVTQL